ncbi:MAG: galactose-1-phosphate uridylyltransferase [Firmicutes bacterium]|nr:galactose-1-phosphate uridylyltransferase [Bacillota bacterium]
MAQIKFNTADLIAGLCNYGEITLGLTYLDRVLAENSLLALFGQGAHGNKDLKFDNFVQDILTPLADEAIDKKIYDKNSRANLETFLLGFVTPAPSAVVSTFDSIASTETVAIATDYLYNLSCNAGYIREKDIAKNIKWTAPGEMGDLVVTINLAKPEKDNKQVALEKSLAQTNYPKCPICIESVGFWGRADGTARQTLRPVPMFLAGEAWYLQFSPYVYYDHHSITFSEKHSPMIVSPKTYERLFDFCEMFPHYFMGSNADLPIVGGSILSHDHYQGGKKVMPMFNRPARRAFQSQRFPDVNISVLDWYNSVIKLESFSRRQLQALAEHIVSAWNSHNDKSCDIISHSGSERHNTVTPIALVEDGIYTLYIILRNNRTDANRPHGIFHPTEDMHNIKKEGIGLIECMGIFILPGRLNAETKAIMDILTGKTPLNFRELSNPEHPLSAHLAMIMQLTNDFGTALSVKEAEGIVVNYINQTCTKILNCTAVFKNNEAGQAGFDKFLSQFGKAMQ